MEIFADTQDPERVYVLNAPMTRSIDGGKTFPPIPTPHGDNHDLWIHPEDNQVMSNANDGGANISLNGGASWSSQENQPTAQFYRVITGQSVPLPGLRRPAGQFPQLQLLAGLRTGGIDWKGLAFGGGLRKRVPGL